MEASLRGAGGGGEVSDEGEERIGRRAISSISSRDTNWELGAGSCVEAAKT
jgi:hypothetical protein